MLHDWWGSRNFPVVRRNTWRLFYKAWRANSSDCDCSFHVVIAEHDSMTPGTEGPCSGEILHTSYHKSPFSSFPLPFSPLLVHRCSLVRRTRWSDLSSTISRFPGQCSQWKLESTNTPDWQHINISTGCLRKARMSQLYRQVQLILKNGLGIPYHTCCLLPSGQQRERYTGWELLPGIDYVLY